MKGIVEINKVYRDGTKELVCRDNNIITDGLGVTLGNIFTDKGDVSLSNHIMGYFQVGTGYLNPAEQDISKAKYISTLQNAVNNEDAYGKDSELQVEQRSMVQYHPVNFSPVYQESWVDSTFVVLPDSTSTKVVDGVVNYQFTLTESMLNDLDSEISEFGLFIRDANSNVKNNQPLLAAYKNLAEGTGILKNKEFAITIEWKLEFITDSLSSDQSSTSTTTPNVVFIMLDDVGVDHLGLYADINPIDLTNAAFPNARPVSQVEDSTNGKNIYPYMPTLSAIAANGMTMYNTRTQPACSPTRSVLLTGKYNGSTKNAGLTGAPYWGPGYGMVAETNAKRRGGLRGLNDGYSFYDISGAIKNLPNQVRGADGTQSRIIFQPLLGDHCREKLGYKSAMFGKWHLNAWSETKVYCEDGPEGEISRYGSGWSHIQLKGKWDHYFATFTNLNSDPIPGVTVNGSWENGDNSWPNYTASTFNTGGKTMGYVNYFVAESTIVDEETQIPGQIIHTVSDSGYVSYAQSISGIAYGQGSPNSFSTNYILSAASAYYNQAQQPFFMYISPNAPHTPYTYPPSAGVYTSFYNSYNKHVIMKDAYTNGKTLTASQTSSNWITANAMLENFDFQLSSFLQGLNETKKANTIFIITSDNGAVGPDIGRRAAYASSIGLGSAGPTLVGGDYTGSGGLGATYDKLLNYGAYCSGLGSGGAYVGDTSGPRRGGESDSANNFKASLYDRAMLVPMVVSGVGVLSGVSTSALIDINDILATLTDIAGKDPAESPEVPADSISFYDILTGKTDASSHARQYSYGEVFFPIGNSTGPLNEWGSYSGFIGCNNEEVAGVTADTPNPTIPRRRRQALTIRFKPDDFIGKVPSRYLPTVNELLQNGQLNASQHNIITNNVNFDQAIPDVSGGLWKVIRPSSGRIAGVGADFARNDFPDPDDASDTTPFTIGKGGQYEELYHLQSTNFSGVDLYELNDYLKEYNKGIPGNHLAASLIVSAIKLPSAQGGINSGAANGGVLDNTVHYWNLARIFDAAHRALLAWNSGRYTPDQSMNFLTDFFGSDEDETP